MTIYRMILQVSVALLLSGCNSSMRNSPENEPAPLNILFITADDLDRNSVGCYGSEVAEITPNIDRFAQEGIRFEHAFINCAICQPSRSVFATGRYGHNSGAMGFMHIDPRGSGNTIMSLLKQQGYLTGVMSKVEHSTPDTVFQWDYVRYAGDLGMGRDPSLYYRYATEFFDQCKEEGKPFYFMVNSDDPHRPFFNPDSPNALIRGIKPPSRIYRPEEIEVPGFVPDIKGVRDEISWYFNSVKRFDDTFGMIMLALKESGFEDNTLVVFISDNGIAIPFAKANTYHASNRSPWIMRWPGTVKPGLVDSVHFISGVDYLPTLLDALQISPPENVDGNSFLSLLKGETQQDRDMVYCQIDHKFSGGPVPMRSVITERFIYIFNPWADGERVYGNNNEGLTMRSMMEEADADSSVALRCEFFRKRILEELYDLQQDPNCLYNLIDDPDYQEVYHKMSQAMQDLMVSSGDPVLEIFENRHHQARLQESFYRLYPETKEWDENKARYSLGAAAYR